MLSRRAMRGRERWSCSDAWLFRDECRGTINVNAGFLDLITQIAPPAVLAARQLSSKQGSCPCYCKDGARMAKITSKFQVTVPKTIADRYNLRPGDEIEWTPAGDVIRVVPTRTKTPSDDPAARLLLFDQATERHRRRPGARKLPSRDRGWTREDLYSRGRSR
jgi:AbrB family looped-hinge helix DNA binding protein